MKRRDWMHFRGKVRSRHVDFVLCKGDDYEPVLVIELDDSSHNSKKRRKRDKFINKALSDAGLPILRVKTQRDYNVEKLEHRIAEGIKD